MTIAFVQSANADSASATTLTINTPAGTSDGDKMIAFIFRGTNAEQTTATTADAGWTELPNLQVFDTSGLDIRGALFHKTASSEGASHDFSHTNNAHNMGGIIATYSGSNIDIDVSPTTSHRATGVNDDTPPNQSITTETNNALVIVVAGVSADDITNAVAPSGYTLRDSIVGMTHRQVMLADKAIVVQGLESPGDWLNDSPTNNGEYYVATVAISEQGGDSDGSFRGTSRGTFRGSF